MCHAIPGVGEGIAGKGYGKGKEKHMRSRSTIIPWTLLFK
jgi:hypothetical protein